MTSRNSCVTIHMAASLDGFIARKDGSVDWLETADEFEHGDTMAPEVVTEFLKTIDCYVMGSRTYETALAFEARNLGWAYGDKPTFVLTSRELRKTRETVEFYSGDLARLGKSFASRFYQQVGVLARSARIKLAFSVNCTILTTKGVV
jgi:dihydrofolate reductase